MKFGTLRGWLLGTAAYLIFLTATMPADYVVHWISGRFPSVQFSGITGTLLSGQAAELRYSGQTLGAIEWHFDWLALFTATLGYRIRLHDDRHDVTGRVDTRFSTVYLRDVSGHLPLKTLDPWSPLPSRSLNGDLTLRVRQLIFKSGRLTGAAGEVELSQAILKWPTNYTLGNFRVLLTSAADGVHAAVSDVASPLSLHADLKLGPKGAYALVGTLAAHDPGDAATRNLLSNLGAPDSTGRYPFNFKGHW